MRRSVWQARARPTKPECRRALGCTGRRVAPWWRPDFLNRLTQGLTPASWCPKGAWRALPPTCLRRARVLCRRVWVSCRADLTVVGHVVGGIAVGRLVPLLIGHHWRDPLSKICLYRVLAVARRQRLRLHDLEGPPRVVLSFGPEEERRVQVRTKKPWRLSAITVGECRNGTDESEMAPCTHRRALPVLVGADRRSSGASHPRRERSARCGAGDQPTQRISGSCRGRAPSRSSDGQR